MADEEKVRIDKWLWAARFFKTRSLATKAVNGGHVHVNGGRVKPARVLQLGDTMLIRRGQTEIAVVVQELSGKRGPAAEAQALYLETGESLQSREQATAQRRIEGGAGLARVRRPDKRDRRKIRKLLRKE